MTDRNVNAPRPLLARPQRLGVAPTMWFWNDAGRQWLLLPLVLATTVPLAIAVQLLVVRWPALSSLSLALVVLYPFLLMGLVERHIRRSLRAAGPPHAAAPLPAAARLVPPLVAVLAALLLALATLELPAVLLVAAVGGGALAAALRPPARTQLPPGEP